MFLSWILITLLDYDVIVATFRGWMADIQVCIDGNFNHRRNKAAGSTPSFIEPRFFIPKEVVDETGERIEKAKKHPRPSYKAEVDEGILDG